MVFEISITPIGKGEHLSHFIAKIIKIIKQSGLPYQLTAMSTQMEGDWEEVMPVIKKCHDESRKYSKRVITSIKIDDHEAATNRLVGKVKDVKKLLRS